MKRAFDDPEPDWRPAKRQRQRHCQQTAYRPRWRSASAPPFSRSLTITTTSLRALDRFYTASKPNMPRPPSSASGRASKSGRSASSDARSKTQLPPKEKLRIYRIYSEEGYELPLSLKAHCDVLKTPRAAPSPNAQLIAQKAPDVLSMVEQDGIDSLRNILLYTGAMDGGRRFVRQTAKPNFNTKFLPQAPQTAVADTVAALEQPQPDYAFGYLPQKFAGRNKSNAPFTQEHEDYITLFTLTPEVHFPYLTAQWKSSVKGGTHDQAIFQAARDGATIINHLHQFYEKADGTTPSVVDTCHFSVTIDLRSIYIFVHWRSEEGSYHMEQIESGILSKQRDMVEVRTVLRNIEDFALSTRLQRIREALDRLSNAPAAVPTTYPAAPLTTVTPTPSLDYSLSSDPSAMPSHWQTSNGPLPLSGDTRPLKRPRSDLGLDLEASYTGAAGFPNNKVASRLSTPSVPFHPDPSTSFDGGRFG